MRIIVLAILVLATYGCFYEPETCESDISEDEKIIAQYIILKLKNIVGYVESNKIDSYSVNINDIAGADVKKIYMVDPYSSELKNIYDWECSSCVMSHTLDGEIFYSVIFIYDKYVVPINMSSRYLNYPDYNKDEMNLYNEFWNEHHADEVMIFSYDERNKSSIEKGFEANYVSIKEIKELHSVN